MLYEIPKRIVSMAFSTLIFRISFHLNNIWHDICVGMHPDTKQECALWKSNGPVNRPLMGLYLKRYNFVANVNHGKI